MSVCIITDSGADIVGLEHKALKVLPLTIVFGDTLYHDGQDLSHEQFYDLLVEHAQLPTTGAVAPGVFEAAYREAQDAGQDVVVVTLSSKLSGTYQSACIAQEEFSNVWVVDSQNVSFGEQILVREALILAEQGLDAASIAQRLEDLRGSVRTLGLLDSLEYLRRGGRLPAAAATIGTLLAMKPVLTIKDGEVELLGKARGSKNARNILNETVALDGGIDFKLPFALGYSGLSDKLLTKYVEDSRSLWEGMVDGLPVFSIGATIGTYAGPGTIELAYFKKKANL
ncbi:MAG: DegV family protein [Atopobiaceae bacterium]|jgi:DegV family protein with EDD domain